MNTKKKKKKKLISKKIKKLKNKYILKKKDVLKRNFFAKYITNIFGIRLRFIKLKTKKLILYIIKKNNLIYFFFKKFYTIKKCNYKLIKSEKIIKVKKYKTFSKFFKKKKNN